MPAPELATHLLEELTEAILRLIALSVSPVEKYSSLESPIAEANARGIQAR